MSQIRNILVMPGQRSKSESKERIECDLGGPQDIRLFDRQYGGHRAHQRRESGFHRFAAAYCGIAKNALGMRITAGPTLTYFAEKLAPTTARR